MNSDRLIMAIYLFLIPSFKALAILLYLLWIFQIFDGGHFENGGHLENFKICIQTALSFVSIYYTASFKALAILLYLLWIF